VSKGDIRPCLEVIIQQFEYLAQHCYLIVLLLFGQNIL